MKNHGTPGSVIFEINSISKSKGGGRKGGLNSQMPFPPNVGPLGGGGAAGWSRLLEEEEIRILCPTNC